MIPMPVRRRARRSASLAVLLIAAILVLLPFLWMVSLAFTPEKDVFGTVSLLPDHPTTGNFSTAFEDAQLGSALGHSAIVTLVAVVTNCVAAVAAGYGFVMLPFKGATPLFYLLVSTAAVPVSATLVPLFLMAKGMPLAGGNNIIGNGGTGLLDSLGGIALPYLVLPMNVFLARQFFLSADPHLAEAARVDGAGELRIFWRIYLPLARPIVAVIAIFSFTAVWDDFLWPLVVSTSPETRTVQLALAQFLSVGNPQYGPLMAGAVVITLPVLAVFLFNQRSFISGLTDGSVKG